MSNPITEQKRLRNKEEQEFWDKVLLVALGNPSNGTYEALCQADEVLEFRRQREPDKNNYCSWCDNRPCVCGRKP